MLPENVGLTVEVIGPADFVGPNGEFLWRIRLPRPSTTVGVSSGRVYTGRVESHAKDAWLRPITPPPGSETESTGEPIKEVA